MEQFKRVKVVMLQGKKSEICLANNKLCKVDKSTYELSHIKTQHLYIISDDEIKEGDWVLKTYETKYPKSNINEVLQVNNIISNNGYIVNGTYYNFNNYLTVVVYDSPFQGSNDHDISRNDFNTGFKKIIATTDKSLGLPQPSQQFITKYIEEYNKDNIITNVLVEYENNGFSGITRKEWLKINPKDNTITIKKVKDSWSREEVKQLLLQAMNYSYSGLPGNLTPIEGMNKWIEENL